MKFPAIPADNSVIPGNSRREFLDDRFPGITEREFPGITEREFPVALV